MFSSVQRKCISTPTTSSLWTASGKRCLTRFAPSSTRILLRPDQRNPLPSTAGIVVSAQTQETMAVFRLRKPAQAHRKAAIPVGGRDGQGIRPANPQPSRQGIPVAQPLCPRAVHLGFGKPALGNRKALGDPPPSPLEAGPQSLFAQGCTVCNGIQSLAAALQDRGYLYQTTLGIPLLHQPRLAIPPEKALLDGKITKRRQLQPPIGKRSIGEKAQSRREILVDPALGAFGSGGSL